MIQKITVILILACMALTLPASAGTDEPVLPPSILPVLFVQGSDYEIGYQYGMQAAQYIEINAEAAWAEALQRFTRQEVRKGLTAIEYYIKTYTPENIDIMQGMAEGCRAAGKDLTYVDILLLNGTLPDPKTSSFPRGAENESLPRKKSCSVCSAWGTATKDGRLLGLDTLDGGGDAMYGVVLVVFPDTGNNYICAAQAGEVGDHFLMNSKGLFLGNSGGGGSPRKEDEDYGIGWACSLPHIVRFADSAAQARNMVMKWKINVPENFHFVDVHGNGCVVEKTAAVQAVRTPGDFGEDDFLFSTNNYMHSIMAVTKQGGFIDGHGGYGAYAAPRNQVFWDMLHNFHGLIDAEFMKMILRFPGSPPPVPPEGGWNAVICRPTNSWVAVLEPDDGDEGRAHICTGPAGRVIHSSTAFDGSTMHSAYQYIHPTHTFFTLHLKSGPAAVTAQAQKDARGAMAAAYKAFMLVKPDDSSYAVCEGLHTDANRAYYTGKAAMNRALQAQGRDAVLLFSQAATCLARCQVKAARLLEVLAPPPTSPSDLGLRPFGGDWASWETKTGTIPAADTE